MKNTIAIVLLTMFLTSCNTDSSKVTSNLIESDVPCITYAPITINQHTYSGDANIFLNASGVGVSINGVDADVNVMHLNISPIQLTGNLSPGQFPIHISNPEFPFNAFYTWAELGIQPTNLVYVYLHFETEQGTGWAGNLKRQSKGQWYYWSEVTDCK